MQKPDRVYLFDIEKAAADERHADLMMKRLPEYERARLMRYKHREDLLRGLYARLQLYYSMSADHGVSDIPAEIYRSKYGKPYVLNAAVDFSFSHSGKWAVCAVSSKNIGVDIERTASVDPELAESILSPGESAKIRGEISSAELCRLWTYKESYVKWKGTGFSTPPEQIYITDDGRCFDGGRIQHCIFDSFLVGGYHLTLCRDADDSAEVKLIYTDTDMISSIFDTQNETEEL